MWTDSLWVVDLLLEKRRMKAVMVKGLYHYRYYFLHHHLLNREVCLRHRHNAQIGQSKASFRIDPVNCKNCIGLATGVGFG